MQLSEHDLEFLRQLRRQFVGQRQRVTQSDPPDESWHSPDVHVARVPAGGIPALSEPGTGTGTGTGTSSEDMIEPGRALCDVYRLAPGTLSLEKVSGLRRYVHNLAREAITVPWVLIFSDKWGVWWADIPATSSSQAQQNCQQVVTDVTVNCVGGEIMLSKTIKYITGTFTVGDTPCQ